ncbi:MAG: hypothetical protein HDR74_08320 [Bacteroides sp.]|nr:hypothetical protein [Bacteroides sp.]
MNKSIVVYCASSSKIDEAFLASARELGRKMARAGVTLLDGGGHTGLMGAVNDGCIDDGCVVISPDNIKNSRTTLLHANIEFM